MNKKINNFRVANKVTNFIYKNKTVSVSILLILLFSMPLAFAF